MDPNKRAKNSTQQGNAHTANFFELFGYDFMIDEDFNVWLIEVNTNPCLEESSGILKMLLPRMLNDAFKLTVDLICKPGINPNPEDAEFLLGEVVTGDGSCLVLKKTIFDIISRFILFLDVGYYRSLKKEILDLGMRSIFSTSIHRLMLYLVKIQYLTLLSRLCLI